MAAPPRRWTWSCRNHGPYLPGRLPTTWQPRSGEPLNSSSLWFCFALRIELSGSCWVPMCCHLSARLWQHSFAYPFSRVLLCTGSPELRSSFGFFQTPHREGTFDNSLLGLDALVAETPGAPLPSPRRNVPLSGSYGSIQEEGGFPHRVQLEDNDGMETRPLLPPPSPAVHATEHPVQKRWRYDLIVKGILFGAINAVILVPVLISFAHIIFRDPYFNASMPYLSKLVLPCVYWGFFCWCGLFLLLWLRCGALSGLKS